MSTIYVPADAATPELLKHAAEAGLDVHIIGVAESVPSVEPANEQVNSVPEVPTNGGSFGVYEPAELRKLPREKFLALHPVITRGARGLKGSIELRAKLNTLPVTGECTLSDDAWDALPKVMFNNGLSAKYTKKDGKVAVRTYGVRTKKDGNLDGRATDLMRNGARLRFDHSNHTVRIINGSYKAMKFGNGIKAPLTRALKTINLG